jgi:hypothetical protein
MNTDITVVYHHHLVDPMADAAENMSPYVIGLIGFAGELVTAMF